MASLASLAAPSRLPASSFRPSASSARSDRVLRSSSMFMVPPCWLGKRPAKQGNGRRPVWLFAEILSLRTALHLGWEDRRLAPSIVLADLLRPAAIEVDLDVGAAEHGLAPAQGGRLVLALVVVRQNAGRHQLAVVVVETKLRLRAVGRDAVVHAEQALHAVQRHLVDREVDGLAVEVVVGDVDHDSSLVGKTDGATAPSLGRRRR